MIYALLDFPDLPSYDLSSLRTLIYGAAPMAPTPDKTGIRSLGPHFDPNIFTNGSGQPNDDLN
ncbi:hypothetical protein [Calidifontibacillus erzurumensis]|uniref:hypothetical protein n=1 Tax=Calidifontibacillus erzurumensis TaxID=2741433 RepID=UPI0035B4FC55